MWAGPTPVPCALDHETLVGGSHPEKKKLCCALCLLAICYRRLPAPYNF